MNVASLGCCIFDRSSNFGDSITVSGLAHVYIYTFAPNFIPGERHDYKLRILCEVRNFCLKKPDLNELQIRIAILLLIRTLLK